MKTRMRAEMHEEGARAKLRSHHQLRKIRFEAIVRNLRQHATDDGDCGVELGVDVFARTGPLAKFEIAIANVAGAAEDRADEVLQISGDVKGEIAHGVGDAGQRRPHRFVVGEQRELALESLEFALESEGDVSREWVHCRS